MTQIDRGAKQEGRNGKAKGEGKLRRELQFPADFRPSWSIRVRRLRETWESLRFTRLNAAANLVWRSREENRVKIARNQQNLELQRPSTNAR
jgi:hypothetical protein